MNCLRLMIVALCALTNFAPEEKSRADELMLTAFLPAASDPPQKLVRPRLGIGLIHRQWTSNRPETTHVEEPFEIRDRDQRIRYPVRINSRMVLKETGSTAETAKYYFLFTGDAPLMIQSVDGQSLERQLEPQVNSVEYEKLLKSWWFARQQRRNDFNYWNAPPLTVTTFVDDMLARRFQLNPIASRPQFHWEDDRLIGFFLGTESIRLAAQTETRLKSANGAQAIADQPLPPGVGIPNVPVPPIPEGVVVEPIAKHVPSECFYLRCGSYSNLSWLLRTLDQWGGNLRQLVVRRHLDHGIRARLERQLALRETELAKRLGDLVIDDLAVIGTDTFVREGSAIGILFQSSKGAVLRAALEQQRLAAKIADPRVTTTTVEIDGHPVSLLSTSDNQVRSFLAVDGEFIFVTNSSELVKRFFAAGAGKNSLADLDEFRYARSQHPANEPAAAFLHLSDHFFRNLLSPQYRIEMTRRMASDVELANIELAQAAARGEGSKFETLADLRSGSYLPPDFESRSDLSRSLLVDGHWTDSHRGARGSFKPIPDMAVTHATTHEVAAYEAFRRQYVAVWERVDPVTINVTKQSVKDAPQREQVVLDIRICPVARQHYGFLNTFLAPPSKSRFAAIPQSVVDIQGVMRSIVPGQIQLGMLDGNVKYSIKNGIVQSSSNFNSDEPEALTVYSVAKKDAASLSWLTNNKELDEDGFYRDTSAFPWLRWTKLTDNFVFGAQRKDVIKHVISEAKLETADRAAQIRLRVGDLSASKSYPIVRAQAYLQDVNGAFGSAFLLNELTQQLGVPPNQAPAVMQRVLDGRLMCALGGELKFDDLSKSDSRTEGSNEAKTQSHQLRRPFPHWQSTALRGQCFTEITSVPNEYRSSLFEWWHGLDLEFTIQEQTLTVRAAMELKP